jgi:hypothetical protein
MAQLVLEFAHHRRAKLRELHPPKIGRDMQIQVLLIPLDGRALELVLLRRCDPQLAGGRDCDALAIGGVDAVSDLDFRGSCEGLRRLLPRESLEVALAVLIDIVDHPSFLRLALPRHPDALANGHAGLRVILGSR